jgi:hypothetical protein
MFRNNKNNPPKRIVFIVAYFTVMTVITLINIVYFCHFTIFRGICYTKVDRTGSFRVCKVMKLYTAVYFPDVIRIYETCR